MTARIYASYSRVQVSIVRESSPVHTRPKAMRTAADVASLCQAIIKDDPREHFLALYLDGRHQLIAAHVVAIGQPTSCRLTPREVLQPAIGLSAHAIVVAHNHPSGDPSPSEADHKLTSRLRECTELLGLTLLDHVVLGSEDFYSFAGERREDYSFHRGVA